MSKRKVFQLKAGNIKNLKIVEQDLKPPLDHEVSIAIRSIGLNFADLFAIWGLYSATPEGVFTPGLEYSGEIIEVGKEVRNVKVGDRVMGITRFGAYATHLNIDSRYAIPLPDAWSFEQGAAYLVQMLTAYYGLIYLGDLKKGSTVLIHSAAGGVGIWANRIAKQFDAFTIGSIGRSAKESFLKEEGYDRVIVRGNDFSARLKESIGDRSLKLIMECIGGKIFEIGYQQMAPMGRMVVYGSARYASPGDRPNYPKMIYQFLTRPKIDPQKMIEENKAILGFNLIWLYEEIDLLHQILKEVSKLNLGLPHVGHTFRFENLPAAIKLFQSGKTIGKVVVNV